MVGVERARIRREPGPPRLRKIRLTLSVTAVAAMVISGCSSNKVAARGTGDPGNHRLQQLQHEKIVALPPGAVPFGNAFWFRASWDATKGSWRDPGFTWGFSDDAPAKDVIGFYDGRAGPSGWSVAGSASGAGVDGAWTKTYPGGYHATVTLVGGYDLVNKKAGPTQYTFYGDIEVIPSRTAATLTFAPRSALRRLFGRR